MMMDNDMPKAMGFLQAYRQGMSDYSQSGEMIPDMRLQNKYAQEMGGPLVEENLISGSPSFDLSVPDIPALGPETPASMRNQQLNMLMPGFSERAKRVKEKYQNILRGV